MRGKACTHIYACACAYVYAYDTCKAYTYIKKGKIYVHARMQATPLWHAGDHLHSLGKDVPIFAVSNHPPGTVGTPLGHAWWRPEGSIDLLQPPFNLEVVA